jgi:hypothetical protein
VDLHQRRIAVEDVTAQAGQLYQSTKALFEDLNRLGQDFGQALREENAGLDVAEQYSYSPNELVLKTNHTWLYSRAEPGDAQALNFAALLVYFEAAPGDWKIGPKGRPELWFFAGRVRNCTTTLKTTIRTFLYEKDRSCFTPLPALGGSVSFYNWTSKEDWKAVCLAYELGDICSADDLKRKAVRPLLVEALQRGLLISPAHHERTID